ncbi:gastrula zinc finger protein XlCGF8.2DB-like [Neolamprologus brichardi]|uniref:gastrula zinc finger protein XlCGF8.2DB-like n=1 Tax=Neolamprologus brichardi TaxID=32507 RepID=UPI001643DFB8|nr:gastrula zinc finger protein XlCGF8.2DB-like [Neolamprologus brichardi]
MEEQLSHCSEKHPVFIKGKRRKSKPKPRHTDDLKITHPTPTSTDKPVVIPLEKTFTTMKQARRHQRTDSGDRSFRCNCCGKSFTHNSSLKRHHLIHAEVKPFSCDHCGKSFSQHHSLKKHQLIHNGFKPFSCEQCGKAFTSKSNLKGHQLIHTGVKPFSCDQCGKSFTSKSNLTAHQLIHTGFKPFSYDIVINNPLIKVLISHATVSKLLAKFRETGSVLDLPKCTRVYVCVVTSTLRFCCSITACHHFLFFVIIGKRRKIMLKTLHTDDMNKNHTTAASTDKPVVIPVEKTFNTMKQARRHQRTDRGDRSFRCDRCGRSFTQKSHLKQHQRIHTGSKPFSCDQCVACQGAD